MRWSWCLVAAALAMVLHAPARAFAEPPVEERAKAPGVYERDVVEVAPETPVTSVHVDNRLGDVRVEGHDGTEVTISAYKRALDQETLDRLKVQLVPDGSGAVRIATSLATGVEAKPIPGGSVAIDLVIRAPRDARVDARLWDGHLEIRGMENGAELSVNQGDIEVKNASGAITTHAASGAQTFSEVYGKVHAQTVSGRMSMAEVRGDSLDASVHQGRIDGRDVRVRELSLRATKGDIHLAAEVLAGGSYRVATFEGDIRVEMSSRAPFSVRAYSAKGRVDMPDSLGARSAKSGHSIGSRSAGKGAQAVLELRSRVGNIQLAVVE